MMMWQTLLEAIQSSFLDSLATPLQIFALGCAVLGVGLQVGGSLVRTMLPLRWLTVASCLALLVYGALSPSMSTLAASLLLLPINVYRAIEVTRLTRQVRGAAAAADHVGHWLKPHMKVRKLKAGQVLFNKGDRAEHLYLLAQGQMTLADIGQPLPQGRIFGEIALFSPEHRRTRTVQALTACTVLQIHESTVRQLYYQHPDFGFHLIELLAEGLAQDVARAEAAAQPTQAIRPEA
ncbi:Crp/Fnr family transcriptional regulator [Paucibacter soli]|uniref:Crp/Fnr family transcriptional regulator n=1 Tax=Paucibacter soli TaxID=3133433 RepID=UPI0030B73992